MVGCAVWRRGGGAQDHARGREINLKKCFGYKSFCDGVCVIRVFCRRRRRPIPTYI